MKKKWFLMDYRYLFACVRKLFKIMRLSVLLIVFSSLQLLAVNNFAQSKRLNLNVQNATITDVLEIIEDETDYFFFYNNQFVSLDKEVSINLTDKPITEVLDVLFEGKNIKYTINNRQIILSEKDRIRSVVQQTKKVSGKVTDASGAALPGVSIVIKGTTTGSITDSDGNFNLSNVSENATLIFSFVGMQTQEVAVAGQTNFNIILQEDAIGIEEVVAIGYGTVRKRDLTGSVTSVKSDNIEKANTASLNDALQGLAAGVQVTSQSGRPGEAAGILIRGGSSISASNSPLYVIDGFPQLGGDNMDLNPQDIESVEILKDASAGAIYGARASNGVVIITTKSGRQGSIEISYDGKASFSNIIKKLETIDNVDYAKIQQFFANEEEKYLYDNLDAWANDSIQVDWQDEAYRTALMQTHNLSISGGNQKTKYVASLGYLDQEGIAHGSDYSRVNSRARIDSKINEKLEAGSNLYFSFAERNGPSLSGESNAGKRVLDARPYVPSTAKTDNWQDYEDPDFQDQFGTNPLKWITESQQLRQNISIVTSNYIQYAPIKDLVFRANGVLRYFGNKGKSYLPSDVSSGKNYGGIGSVSHNQTLSWLYENILTYKLELGNHIIKPMIGASAQSQVYESLSGRSTNFAIETLGADKLELGAAPSSPQTSKWKSTLGSFFGRLNYSAYDRYLLTGTIRADGASNFGPNNKWGVFPSGAFAWRASEENFVKKLDTFSNLKLRVSYGITGNNSIGRYASMMQFNSANISINSTQNIGLIPGKMANEDLKWEENKQFNFGIDVGFFDNKLNITADYYKKKSNDLLLNAPIPSYSGFTTFTSNIGDIEASGFEFDVNSVIFSKRELKWKAGFNISFPKTKVLRLSDSDFFFTGKYGHKSNMFIVKEGEPLGAMYGYVYDGVNQDQDEVDNLAQLGSGGKIGGPRYKDISGPEGVPDGVISSEFDRTVIGNGIPDWFGGFTNNIKFKNFDLSILFTFRYGNEVINTNKNFLWLPGVRQGGLKHIMDAWTPENKTNDIWAWDAKGLDYENLTSWVVEDGSFLRLNNITLGYNFPSKVIQPIGIKYLRFYISGDKLLTFSKYSGYDPDVSLSRGMLTPGVDESNYPHSKSITLGAKIKF